ALKSLTVSVIDAALTPLSVKMLTAGAGAAHAQLKQIVETRTLNFTATSHSRLAPNSILNFMERESVPQPAKFWTGIRVADRPVTFRCLLWVRSGHMQRTNPCPLYPNSERESGHLPPGHVCFTPESGHVRCNGSCRLWAISGHCHQNGSACSMRARYITLNSL